MRCSYCYNPDIVLSKEGSFSLEYLYNFLKTRVGLLDAVVLSGGEATSFELFDICSKIKELGFKIKLDTNGSNPKQIKNLLDNNFLDYVALDFKAPENKYKQITHSTLYKEFVETLNILNNSKCKFEVRTTLHNDLLDVEDINHMQNILVQNNYKRDFYIQKFLDVENLANLEASNKLFDTTKLNDDLNIVWRD
jgi:pyruvate formate lyase activating enzyme